MKNSLFWLWFLGKIFENDSGTPFTFFPMYRNVRDIEIGLICKLHNDAQRVTSHCIMILKRTAARTRNLITKLGKSPMMFYVARISSTQFRSKIRMQS